MKRIASLLLLAALATTLLAQKPAAPAQKAPEKQPVTGAPTEQEVLKLLDLLQVEDGVKATIETMKDQLKAGAEQNF
ncbi:MAG TPA: hypothetical protein VE783_01315, partial [Candidatus Limnocylindrales bacterium]|nr:hypothetical protein [Candidatus Limnocylindrales bacterium]